jgi:hypothetical protein
VPLWPAPTVAAGAIPVGEPPGLNQDRFFVDVGHRHNRTAGLQYDHVAYFEGHALNPFRVATTFLCAFRIIIPRRVEGANPCLRLDLPIATACNRSRLAELKGATQKLTPLLHALSG